MEFIDSGLADGAEVICHRGGGGHALRLAAVLLAAALLTSACSRSAVPAALKGEPTRLDENAVVDELAIGFLKDPDATRAKWEGRYVEMPFTTYAYEKVGDRYRFKSDTPPYHYCEVDYPTFEKISLHQAGSELIVRGTIGAMRIDEPFELEGCEVVKVFSGGGE